MIRINFSGHPVAGFDLAPFVGVNLPVDSAAALEAVIRDALLALPYRDELLAGTQAEVIPPGMGCAVAVLLAEWHGQYGSFPRVRWAVRGSQGFGWPDEAVSDLQTVRLSARSARR